MKNRNIGILIIGIAALIGFIIYSFNSALTDIVSAACSHGSDCPMWGTINFQTNVSLGIMIFVILTGLYLIFFGDKEKVKHRVEFRKISKDEYGDILKKLEDDEKQVFEKIIEENGTIFQSKIVEKTELGKVKVTRILDRLENKGLIERKRRGMTNIVVINNNMG